MKVGQTFLSAHVAEEALSAVSGTGRRQAEDASAQMCLLCFCLQDNRKDGRFFATLRMTCIAIAIAEMFRSYLRQTCHPEEAGLKVGQTFLSARIACLPCQARQAEMPPRKCVYCVSAFRTIEKTGDSSTTPQNDMLFDNSQQMYPTHVRLNCHPEEAGCEGGADIPVCPRR